MNTLPRRALLGLLAARLARTATASHPVGFAIGTYGMRTVPTREAFRLIAEIGYDGVALALMPGWPADPARLTRSQRQEIRDGLRESGLALPSLNESLPITGLPQDRGYNLERINRAASLAHFLVPSAPPCLDTILGGKSGGWASAREGIATELRDWAQVAEAEDFTIGIKPHAGHAVDTPEKAVWLMKQLASPRLRLIYDYSHMAIGGFGLGQSLREMLPYTSFISLKDSEGTPENFTFLLPGAGATDYIDYFKILRELGYQGFVSVEVSSMVQRQPDYNPSAAARLCYRRLAPAFLAAGLPRPVRHKGRSPR